MPTSAERRRFRVRLSVAKVNRQDAHPPVLEFPLVAVAPAAGALAALVGWLLVTGLVMAGWFTAMAIPLPRVLGFAGQLWLAAHGAGALVGQVMITIVPLGITALCLVLARSLVALVLRAAPAVALEGRGVLRAWGLSSAGYAFVACVIALASGAAPRVGWALLGGALVGGLGAGWALRRRLLALRPLPRWLVGVPQAILGGVATLTAISAAVLLVALIVGGERVGQLENALAPDGVGSWLLVIAQLLFLPNLLAWTASWVLGAGFSVGVGSFVSPMLTSVGLLPAIPVFGAVPQPGGGNAWAYAWLLSGLLTGAVAGVVSSARPAVGGTLVRALARGAGSGLGTALAVVLIGVLSRGDLGSGRLVGLGPVLLNLIWLAPLPMVVGGTLAALVHWFARARHLPAERKPSGADDTTELFDLPTEPLDQPTVPLGRRG